MTDSSVHLFIDTNVFLSFFAFTNDDVEQLRKLTKLIASRKLILYVTDQVRDEFYRNRENKITESLGAFKRTTIGKAIPRYMDDYSQAATFKAAAAEMEKARDALVNQATAEAIEKRFAADTLFAEIVSAAGTIKVTDDIVARADYRRLRGNPPGKDATLGDQINWECLLDAAPDGITLNIVSKDGDYASKLDGGIRQFLMEEWEKLKKGHITLHSEIKPFLNHSFPDIKLAVDVEKQEAVSRLVQSGSFQTTHEAISALQIYIDALTWENADAIFNAGLQNTQIAWIGTDSDVRDFYRKLMDRFDSKLLADRKAELEDVFKSSVFDDYAEYAAMIAQDASEDDSFE